MRSFRWVLAALAVPAAVACVDEPVRRSGQRLLPLVVEIAADRAPHIRLDSVVRVLAPMVTFLAVVRPNLLHGGGVPAPRSGRVVTLHRGGVVRPADTVAIVREASDVVRPIESVVRAGRAGYWWPLVARDSEVVAGDPIGVVQPEGLILVVGTVPGIEARRLRRGDPAVVQFAGESDSGQGARIERIRPGLTDGGPVEVAVEVRRDFRLPPPAGAARVLATPVHWAVPSAALARGSFGEAVFTPVAPGEFRAIWIAPEWRREQDMVVVAEDLSSVDRVVTGGLLALVQAVEDSLHARASGR